MRHTGLMIIVLLSCITASIHSFAQKELTIQELEKICSFSTEQCKQYAVNQHWLSGGPSNVKYDTYKWKDANGQLSMQKNKISNLIIFTMTSASYYDRLKDNLMEAGYSYSGTEDGSPPMAFYKHLPFTAVLYSGSPANGVKEYYLSISKEKKEVCGEWSIAELEEMSTLSAERLKNYFPKKGYVPLGATTASLFVVSCNKSEENSLLVAPQSYVKLMNISVPVIKNLLNQVKQRGYTYLMEPVKTDKGSVTRFGSKAYEITVTQLDDGSISLELSSNSAQRNQNDGEENSDKLLAEKNEDGNYEITSYTNSTDIRIQKGQTVHMTATGTVTYGAWAGSGGPEGISGYTSYNLYEGFRHGCLLYRIGEGAWEAVGRDKIITAKQNGILQLVVNDRDPSNNSGAFHVSVSVNKVER